MEISIRPVKKDERGYYYDSGEGLSLLSDDPWKLAKTYAGLVHRRETIDPKAYYDAANQTITFTIPD